MKDGTEEPKGGGKPLKGSVSKAKKKTGKVVNLHGDEVHRLSLGWGRPKVPDQGLVSRS